MKIINLKDLSRKDYQRIVSRSAGMNPSIMSSVRITMNKIQKQGDKMIFQKYQMRFGKENYQSIQVTKEEIKKAYSEVGDSTIKALRQMIKNITLVQKAQLTKKIDTIVQSENGIKVWREWRAIEKVGLYIPGGKAIYPSSVLMTAIPAQISGCKEIIMCSPPRGDGQIPSATLVAADMIGLKNIYKLGGVEAIAAMTYGTKTIPRVDKIVGPGNIYVNEAKRQVFGLVDIDMIAVDDSSDSSDHGAVLSGKKIG